MPKGELGQQTDRQGVPSSCVKKRYNPENLAKKRKKGKPTRNVLKERERQRTGLLFLSFSLVLLRPHEIHDDDDDDDDIDDEATFEEYRRR